VSICFERSVAKQFIHRFGECFFEIPFVALWAGIWYTLRMVYTAKELKIEIKGAISRAILSRYGREIAADSIELAAPPDPNLGDFTYAVFPLAKELKQSPQAVSGALAEALTASHHPCIDEVKTVGAYMNICLKEGLYARGVLNAIFEDQERYGSSVIGAGAGVLIEYSQPNTNKPQHIGHFRNNVLGDSLSRILAHLGYTVIKANIINDRGIHICKSMLAYQKWGNRENPDTLGLKPDHFVGKYYALFSAKEKEEPSLLEEAQNLLKKWEEGDAETQKLWAQMNQWVYEGWESTYRNLGITFDEVEYESKIYTMGRDMILAGVRDGIFYKREDGAVEANLEDHKLGKKVLLRKDGTSVYIVQDIALAHLRIERHPDVSRFVYIVASPQEYHFKVLFRVLDMLGVRAALFHLSYGLVALKTGKMSSRDGNVVLGDVLMDELRALAREELAKRGTRDDERAKKIGIAALKYYLLKIHPSQKLLFDKDAAMSFEGNAGPYMLYTYARIQSILRKAGVPVREGIEWGVLKMSQEKEIIQLLDRFADELIHAGITYNPGHLCNYLWSLAKSFNAFYHDSKIIHAESRKLSIARIALADAVSRVIKIGLGLLGIEPTEQM